MNEAGRLRFYRRRSWQDLIRSYRVEVDGELVGRLRPRGELTVDVSPGRHRVRARIDWTGSPEVEVQIGPGETVPVFIGRGPGRSALGRALSADRYLTIVPDPPAPNRN